MRKAIIALCAAIFAGLLAKPAMACTGFNGKWGCLALGADPGTGYNPIDIQTKKVNGVEVLYFGNTEVGLMDGQWHDRKPEALGDIVDRKTKVTCEANQLTIEDTYRDVKHNDAETWNDEITNAMPSGASKGLESSAERKQRGIAIEGSGYLFIHQATLYYTGVRRSPDPEDSFVYVQVCHRIGP